MKPHLSRYWLNNKRAENPEQFDETVKTVCDLYAQAAQLHEQGVHLLSTDEKTGIQALECIHPTRPMQPGQVERREFEYERHGTLTLIANFEVATGQCPRNALRSRRSLRECAATLGHTDQLRLAEIA